MSMRSRLVVATAVSATVCAIAGGLLLWARTPTPRNARADVLETVSSAEFGVVQAIVLVPPRPGDQATVPADQLADRLEAAGFRSNLLESPKLVRFKGGAVPGAVGSGGLMWALVLDQRPEAGGPIVHPLTPSPGATGTYFIVFLSADTGDYIMALGGEKFDR